MTFQPGGPAQKYLSRLKSERSRVTMTSFLSTASAFFENNDTAEHFAWRTMRSEAIMALIAALLDQGKAPATVNTYLSALKGVAREAYNMGAISSDDYMRISDIQRVKDFRVSKPRRLNAVELELMLDHCASQGGPIAARDVALIAVACGAGLRRQEIVALCLDDYQTTSSQLKVSARERGFNDQILGPHVVQLIDQWIEQRGHKSGPLFVRIYKGGTITNLPITTQTVYDIVTRRYQEAGLKRLTPRDIRASYTEHLLDNGVSINSVKEILGHETLSTTKRYRY